METAYQSLVVLHLVAAIGALLTFYVPILSRKGSRRHRRAGHYYAHAMRWTAYSGILLSLCLIFLPLAVKDVGTELSTKDLLALAEETRAGGYFLMMLGLLILVSVNQAISVLQVKADNQRLRTVRYLAPPIVLVSAAAVMIVWGLVQLSVIIVVFSLLCLWVSGRAIRYACKDSVQPGAWLGDHIGGMLGSGLGAHMAFLVNGGQRFFKDYLSVESSVALWVAPLLIGVAAIFYMARKYAPERA